MSGKKETYVYGSLKERFALEWKIYALAFGFILIADNIGQIKIPVGKGMFILFPIFYAIILGVLSGPQVLKIVDNRHVKAASKLVVVGICPFIAKLGITAGANIDGLPGETVQIKGGYIFIDGELLNAEDGLEQVSLAGRADTPIKLEDNEYFLLGDNRDSSEDSRFPNIGNVKREQIQGKVWFRIFPLLKLDFIHSR